MCKSNNSVKTFVMVASIFLITMLAFDRYWSLSKIRSQSRGRRYLLYIALTWILSGMVSFPQFSRSKLEGEIIGNRSCRVIWQDDESDTEGTWSIERANEC